MLSEIYQHFGLLKQQNIFDLGLEYEIDYEESHDEEYEE